MKRKHLFYATAIASVMLFSCDKNEKNPNEGGENPLGGTTHASLVVNTNPQTKATKAPTSPTDGQSDYGGIDAEKKVAQLDVVSSANHKTFALNPNGGLTYDTPSSLYKTKAWITEAGTRNMAVVANKNGNDKVARLTPQSEDIVINPTVANSAVSAFAKAYSENKGTEAGYTMTSTIDEITVADNVTEAQANAGSHNSFKKNLERVVSKAVVTYDETKKKDIKTDLGLSDAVNAVPVGTDPKNPVGYILVDDINSKNLQSNEDYSGLAFSVEHSALPIYLYANHAGERQLSVSGNHWIYKGFESAIHTWNTTYDKDPSDLATNIVRLGNLAAGSTYSAKTAALGDFQAVPVSESNLSTSATNYFNNIDFLENSCSAFVAAKAYHRIAFAKVYGTFIPAQKNLFVGEKEGGALAEGSDKVVKVRNIKPEEYSKKYGTDKNFTIYFGIATQLYYTSAAAAIADGNYELKSPPAGLGDKVKVFRGYKYANGRCGYRVALNRQKDGNVTKYCDTRRNNIYKIRIDGFKKVGMPYDPIDPKDPYLPKTDETNPEPPVDPEVDKTDTYMAVTATVVEWNVVNRGEILE